MRRPYYPAFPDAFQGVLPERQPQFYVLLAFMAALDYHNTERRRIDP
jgi:hypothetical protein